MAAFFTETDPQQRTIVVRYHHHPHYDTLKRSTVSKDYYLEIEKNYSML